MFDGMEKLHTYNEYDPKEKGKKYYYDENILEMFKTLEL